MTERKCAQDEREEQLKKEGKTYFRIGRAIFIVDTTERKMSTQELLDTPLGLATALAGTANKLIEDEALAKEMHGLFMPTGYLRIKVEGDPDAGIAVVPNEVLLTGYRFGLDDVIVDGKLLNTTHGSRKELIKALADALEREKWHAEIAFANETADECIQRKKHLAKIKRTLKKVLEIAEGAE